MAQKSWLWLKTYIIPLLTVGLALLLTLLLRSLLQPITFPFFYAAVTSSAWAGGIIAGLLKGDSGSKDEHAAIPTEAIAGEEGFGDGAIGFFGEALDAISGEVIVEASLFALFNVAIPT